MNRRKLLRTAPAACAVAALPAADALARHQSDADLFHLGAEFDRLLARWLQIHAELSPVFETFDVEMKRRLGEKPFTELFRTVDAEVGYEAAAARNNDALEDVDQVAAVIRSVPAKTIAGLAVKARVAAFDCGFSREMNEPEEDMDWDALCFLGFIREIERLARGESEPEPSS